MYLAQDIESGEVGSDIPGEKIEGGGEEDNMEWDNMELKVKSNEEENEQDVLVFVVELEMYKLVRITSTNKHD